LTHADQGRFQSLDSVSKTDLSSEFNAIQYDQQPEDQIRGIPVADLPVKKDERMLAAGLEEPASPTTDAIPYLPITPPRPKPPPKDGLMSPYSPTDFRLSRSMENFSRPTRLSVTTVDISPTSTISQRLSVMSPVGQPSALVKPLPHLPDGQVVHAVSTRDDIALPLPTAPLPSPPKPVMEVLTEETAEEGQTSHLTPSPSPFSMLHTLPVPTTRQHKRRSQSSGELQFDNFSFGGSPARDPDAVRNEDDAPSPKTKNRISIAVKATGIEEWDDAIDYSWEHAAELEDEADAYSLACMLGHPSSLSIPHENYLFVEQNNLDETTSSASTPLMMQGPDKPFREVPNPSPDQKEEPLPSLLGLGINALQPPHRVSLGETGSNAQPEAGKNSFTASEGLRSRIMRSPVSMMSKSSSQESFIASIFGTHRSSNSSTSLSDFAHLATGSFAGSLESLKLDLQDFTSMSSATDKHIREGSQDTIREDSHRSRFIEALPETGDLVPLPRFSTSPIPKHDRGASASAIPSIPRRKSSLSDAADTTKTHPGRKRANTGASRPRRNTRVSYSLFPTTTTT
jgi:hypothetical protein